MFTRIAGTLLERDGEVVRIEVGDSPAVADRRGFDLAAVHHEVETARDVLDEDAADGVFVVAQDDLGGQDDPADAAPVVVQRARHGEDPELVFPWDS